MCERNPLLCIIPPYIHEHLAKNSDEKISSRAKANLRHAVAYRANRSLMAAKAAPARVGKYREVYDAQSSPNLPGKRVRKEGDPPSADVAVNEAYDYAGNTYDFYNALFQRDSLDNKGLVLVSSVHVGDENGQALDNAYWDGSQMAYGDGDGVIFTRFTQSQDVVSHELTHGVQSFTSNLPYQDQSGALNEHFADVFGIIVRQWMNKESVTTTSWLIGREVIVPAPTRRAIRDMENPGTAFKNDPYLGDDPQPGHMDQLYTGADDNGGVHINSGIPNRAFVAAAKAIGGNSWDVTGRIWFQTMVQLQQGDQFAECAELCRKLAQGFGAAAGQAVDDAWKLVGL